MTLPDVPHCVPVPVTKENLDYVDLAIIDLSKADTEEGRAALAIEVREALISNGCFYVVNHGYPQPQTMRMFDIADVPFTGVSNDDKQSYLSTRGEDGAVEGYIILYYTHSDGDVHKKIQRYAQYAINHDVTTRKHPDAIIPFLPEIEEFNRHNHFNVLHPILNLMARSLELPEDTLVNMHGYDINNDSSGLPSKEEAKSNNARLKGHTDFGSVTILWSQPIAGLQIRNSEGEWRWVRHMENALVFTAGDAMDFITGGYYKGTVHRVTQAPKDQQNYDRVGVFYFARLDDDVRLAPLAESPVLQRAGIQRRCDDSEALTMEQWRRARSKAYGSSELKSGKEKGVEEEVIDGVLVKHYN